MVSRKEKYIYSNLKGEYEEMLFENLSQEQRWQ